MSSRSVLLDAARVLRGASMVLTEMAKLQPGAAGTAATTNIHRINNVVSSKSTAETHLRPSPPPPPSTSSSSPQRMTIVNGADLPNMEAPPNTILEEIKFDASVLSSNPSASGNDDPVPSSPAPPSSSRVTTTEPEPPSNTATNASTATITSTATTTRSPLPSTTAPSSSSPSPSSSAVAPSIPSALDHKPQKVPATQMSRVLGFGGLGARLAFGTVGELVRRQFVQIAEDNTKRAVLSDGNMDALASTLCRMRGAALKLGQMLSMADNTLVPKELTEALDRVRQHADRMPEPQLNETMENELGGMWRDRFVQFDDMPLAAASLGQVHRAKCVNGEQEDQDQQDQQEELDVVVKVQYPGVADSIDSDIENVMRLVRWTNFAPKGLYIDEVMRVARKELKLECDYVHEAKMQEEYHSLLYGEEQEMARNQHHMMNGIDVQFVVPRVQHELSTERVLTSEWVRGVPLDQVSSLDQTTKDDVGSALLWLTMTELFDWRFMQTDPNWGNFLYDEETSTIGLIDFGAARPFDSDFTDQYLRLVWGSAERDEEMVVDASVKLGFLTGDESRSMVEAHLAAAYAIGEPFALVEGEKYNFYQSDLTERVTKHLHVFGRERLRPPPEDAYALHRKLAGSFMACIRLGSKVECRPLLRDLYQARWGSD